MADTKLTAMTALASLATGDILYVVDDPGGSPLIRKVTIDVVATYIAQAMSELILSVTTLGAAETDKVKVAAADFSAGNAALFIRSESGSSIGIGSDKIQSAAATFTITTSAANGSIAITPTGTGDTLLTAGQLSVGGTAILSLGRTLDLESTTPGWAFYESDAALDEKAWDGFCAAGLYTWRTVNDALSAATVIMQCNRNGQSPEYISFSPAGGSSVCIGTTVMPSANGSRTLTFGDNAADPTLGLNTAAVYAKDVAGTVEIFVKDEGGTATQISAHYPVDAAKAAGVLIDANDPFPAVSYSVNQYLGYEQFRYVAPDGRCQVVNRPLPPSECLSWDEHQGNLMKEQKARQCRWEERREHCAEKIRQWAKLPYWMRHLERLPLDFNESRPDDYIKKNHPLART